MVYLIDTKTNELDSIEVDGVTQELIRHSYKAIEKHYPVMCVTNREEITYCVCDYISFDKFKPKKKDTILSGNKLYLEKDLNNVIDI